MADATHHTLCRAARGALGWSIDDLAQAAGVGVMTVHRFEGGQSVRASSINRLTAAFAAAGIVMIATDELSSSGGVGIRFQSVGSEG